MSQAQRTVLLAIAGLLAGVLVWYAIDRSNLLVAITFGRNLAENAGRSATIVGGIIGGVLGLFLGTADALTVSPLRRRIKALVAALVLGVVSGMVAMHISRIVPTEPVIALAVPTLSYTAKHIERPIPLVATVRDFVAWIVLGAAIGAAPGVARKSARLALQGAMGGALGGLIGGFMMPHRRDDSSSHTMSVFGYAFTGGCIGLLAAWLPQWFGKSDDARRRKQHKAPSPIAADAIATPVSAAPAEKRGEFAKSDLHALPATLVCVAGPYDGERFVVPPGTDICIGRGSDQDIAIVEDGAASRSHASVCAREGRHVVIDLGSANGTYLNEAVVTSVPRRLFQGDIIRIGRTELRYEPGEKTHTGLQNEG